MKRNIFIILIFCSLCAADLKKVIIVGSGASGIAAATRLIENNITDFFLLEAEKRLGGRIHSISLTYGGHVDLGGEYVGGEKGNAVYEFAKDSLKHTDYNKHMKTYYSDGTLINHELAEEVYKFHNNLRQEYLGKLPISTADAFSEGYNSTILKKYEKDPSNLLKAKDFIDTCKNIYLYRFGSFDWSNILLNDHYRACDGDQNMSWNGKGYRHFLDLLMRKFGDQHRLTLYPFIYTTTVKKISWNKPGHVELETEDQKKYQTEHVIFTPSVGVLKANHDTLFDPKLSDKKIKAIRDTGFDAAMKVILQFPKKWWDDDLSSFVFVWNEEDKKKLNRDYTIGPKKGDHFWLSSFQRVFTVPGLPNILIGWFTGPLVPEIEKLNPEEIGDGINFIFKTFLKSDYNITKPELVIPSTWYSNPNFRGVYSYETMASGNRKGQTQEDLAEPLLNKNGVPVVLFAGEHTHKTHFSTVHGAVESGYRAADQLVEYLNK